MESIKIHDRNFSLSISPEKIHSKVEELADQINKELVNRDIVFVAVLNGAFMFASDLLKKIYLPCCVSFVKIASYEGVKSSGMGKCLIGLTEDITNKTVVLVEDIVDTGNTLNILVHDLRSKNPGEIIIATLLFKPDAYRYDYKIDYAGFRVPEQFVVGYGLDYNGLGRNLEGIYTEVKNK